jgi:hypothetical protein
MPRSGDELTAPLDRAEAAAGSRSRPSHRAREPPEDDSMRFTRPVAPAKFLARLALRETSLAGGPSGTLSKSLATRAT